jgi:hypothetical protein
VPDEMGLSFAAFYPSAVRQEGLAVSLLLGMLQRARWAAESVFGEEWAGRETPPDAEAVTGT